jgi:uncharacterized membrane protein
MTQKQACLIWKQNNKYILKDDISILYWTSLLIIQSLKLDTYLNFFKGLKYIPKIYIKISLDNLSSWWN